MESAVLSQRAELRAAVRPVALERMIAAFERVDFRSVKADRIAEILLANRIDDAALAPYLHFVPGRYTRIRLYGHTGFEILALCWPAQMRSPIHAHGDSRCFVHVYRGTLVNDEYVLRSGGETAGAAALRHIAAHTLKPGDLDIRTQRRDIHRFTSLDEPAVTLHVYAEPLERCLVFDREREICRQVESFYDALPA